MPLYEYKCSSCNYHFENLQKFSDPLLQICPKCNTQSLSKLISNSYFSLKGSGWHLTDYKKSNYCEKNKTSCPKNTECKNKTTSPVAKEA